MRISAEQKNLLRGMADGGTLKVHRTLDGAKRFLLHPLDGRGPQEVRAAVVKSLQRQGLVESNLKFPAAVFLFTDKGAALAASLTGKSALPVRGS